MTCHVSRLPAKVGLSCRFGGPSTQLSLGRSHGLSVRKRALSAAGHRGDPPSLRAAAQRVLRLQEGPELAGQLLVLQPEHPGALRAAQQLPVPLLPAVQRFRQGGQAQCLGPHRQSSLVFQDGGYNRVIAEQHQTAPEPPPGAPRAANGLCEACNRHQQLRVTHLANYEPRRPADYDKEIEHFQAQLDKSLALCKPCSRTVHETVRRQNAWIFGNRLKSAGRQHRSVGRLHRRVRPMGVLLGLLALTSLGAFCGLVPHTVQRPVECRSLLALSCLGAALELAWVRSARALVKLNRLLAWGLLGLIAAVPFKQEAALYCDTVQVFCSLYLSYTYGATCRQASKPPTKVRVQRRHQPPELDEHFNELNIGPPTPPRPVSPNPFTACCQGAGPEPHRTLLSPSRLDHVAFSGLRTRYVTAFYPYWTPLYATKGDYY